MTISSSPSIPVSQESPVNNQNKSSDRCSNLTSAQSKDETDNSVFDGGGCIGNGTANNNSMRQTESNTNCSQNTIQKNNPSSQYVQTNSNPSPVQHQQQQQQTSPRPRAPTVPSHLLTHHQFWSQNPNVQNFSASQRHLLNGVISNAVSYVTGNNGAAAGGGNICVNISGNNGNNGSNSNSANNGGKFET